MLLACSMMLQPLHGSMPVQATDIETIEKKEDEKYVLDLLDGFDFQLSLKKLEVKPQT